MNKFLLRISFLLLLIMGLSLALSPAVLAQNRNGAPPSQSPIASPSPKAVDSYDLFWPITAGKTMDDPLYFVKELKEKIRGMFIFGDAQKADYEVFLGTKRVIEAEKLLNGNKNEVANSTLDKALKNFESATDNWLKSKADNKTDVSAAQNMRNRLSNLDSFLPFLASSQGSDIASKLLSIRGQVEELLKNL